MVAFLRDKERGAVLIQFALFLPILIVFLMGAFEIWKVLYIKQSLNDAAYQGIRLLCMQPRDGIAGQADALMRRTRWQNTFVRDEALDQARFVISTIDQPCCGDTVTIDLRLEWRVAWQGWTGWWIPPLDPDHRWLRTAASGTVLCYSR